MPLYRWEGELLVENGALAIDENCCCLTGTGACSCCLVHGGLLIKIGGILDGVCDEFTTCCSGCEDVDGTYCVPANQEPGEDPDFCAGGKTFFDEIDCDGFLVDLNISWTLGIIRPDDTCNLIVVWSADCGPFQGGASCLASGTIPSGSNCCRDVYPLELTDQCIDTFNVCCAVGGNVTTVLGCCDDPPE